MRVRSVRLIRTCLGRQAGKLPDVLIDDIDDGLRAVLGI